MILPTTQGAALATALLSMACWGSWGNSLVFIGNRMPFELFYLNYSASLLMTAVLGALLFGIPGTQSFTEDFGKAPASKFLWALLGGLVFNLANLLLCKGIELLGLALAFPLCIGTALVGGSALTYAISPSGSAALLFAGVFVAFLAVLCSALLQKLKEAAKEQLVEKEEGPSMGRKILICIAGGILMSLWNPFVTLAEKGDDGLTPFTEFIFFTLAVLLSSLVVVPGIIVMPLEGGAGRSPGQVLRQYREVPASCHFYSFCGGAVWAIGTLANAVAGSNSELLGSAASYAIGQCANVVAILWGVFLWREFHGTGAQVKGLIVLVLALYVTAISLITAAQ